MIRKLYFVLVLILGLSFNSCTNDISEDVLTNHSSTSSNDEAEIIKLTSDFNIKKENGVYSMGDILLSDEQVKLLDETGSIYPVPNNTLPSDIYSTEFGDKAKIIQPTSGLQYKSIQLFLG